MNQPEKLIAMLTVFGVWAFLALSAWAAPLPFVGVVTQLAEFQDGLFTQLDLNQNGQGDLWVKILTNASIKDQHGNTLALDHIDAGVILVIINFTGKDSFLESNQVMMILPVDENTGPFIGKVLQVERSQGTVSALLDVNGDNQGDHWVVVGINADLKNAFGGKLAPQNLFVGSLVIAINYEDKGEYVELSQAIVLQPNPYNK